MSEDLADVCRQFRATGDPALRDRLTRATIGLVRKVAGRLALKLPPHIEVGDLESAGVPGLLAAIEAYNPDQDASFETYASARIRGAILDELRELDPLPRSLRDKARAIERATAVLEQALMRAPDDDEIADALGISLERYHYTLRLLRGGIQVSLESALTVSPEGELRVTTIPIMDPGGADPLQALAGKERRALLGALIDRLPRAERTVLSLYYFDELTMREIAITMDISESRVSQLHTSALGRVRARLRRPALTAGIGTQQKPALDSQWQANTLCLNAVEWLEFEEAGWGADSKKSPARPGTTHTPLRRNGRTLTGAATGGAKGQPTLNAAASARVPSTVPSTAAGASRRRS